MSLFKSIIFIILVSNAFVFSQNVDSLKKANNKRIDDLMHRVGMLHEEDDLKNYTDTLFKLNENLKKQIEQKDYQIELLENQLLKANGIRVQDDSNGKVYETETYIIIGAFLTEDKAQNMAKNYKGFRAITCKKGKYYYTAKQVNRGESILNTLNEIRNLHMPDAWIIRQ